MYRALVVLVLCGIASGQQYVMSTLAGGVPPLTPAKANTVSIGDPPRVAVDSTGNLFFASDHAIWKVDRGGTLNRIAGTGKSGMAPDGALAATAQLTYPVGIAVDSAGNLFFTERDANLVRKIDNKGILSTVAASTNFNHPTGLTVDSSGNLYVADSGNQIVRRIGTDGSVTTVAGSGAQGYSGDGNPATLAALNGPEGVAVDGAGNLYIADTFNHRVRKVSADGNISTLTGNGLPGFGGDGVLVASAQLVLPTDVAVDAAGNLYIADLGNSRIRKVSSGVIRSIAGSGADGLPVDGVPATSVRLNGPTGVAVDSAGVVYFAEGSIGSGSGLDLGSYHVWKISTDGTLIAAAGTGVSSYSGDLGPAAIAQIDHPMALAMDSAGNLFFADSRNNRVRKIAPDGTVTTVAGNALAGFLGDGGQATAAQLNMPMGVAVDRAGNLFIADTLNNRIREVFPSGIIGTYAGNGNTAFFGDGGISTQAALRAPQAVAFSPSGALYIADTGNHRVRRVINGIIDTLSGTENMNSPVDVAVSPSGNVYIADLGNREVREISFGDDSTIVTTLLDSRAVTAPQGVTTDNAGNVYVSDGNRVLKVGLDNKATVIAGTGQCCYAGDGGPAGAALLNSATGLAVDPAGNLYISDTGNNAIRVASVSSSTFFIRSVANAASNAQGPLAPGEIVTLFGAGLGPATLTTSSPVAGVLPQSLAGTTVLFNGIRGAMLYASAGQVSAIVPYAVTGANVDVTVQVGSLLTSPFTLPLAPASPGLFTEDQSGRGAAHAVNSDGSLNNSSHPTGAGTTVTFFITGEGPTTPNGVDGKIADSNPPQPKGVVSATIGGATANVRSASGVPGVVAGVTAVTVEIPAGLTPGVVPVVIAVGGARTQAGVTVAVN